MAECEIDVGIIVCLSILDVNDELVCIVVDGADGGGSGLGEACLRKLGKSSALYVGCGVGLSACARPEAERRCDESFSDTD